MFLTLVALIMGQSAAGLHLLKHLGPRNDAAGVPAQHAQVCLECASFAPLAGAHAGACALGFVACLASGSLLPVLDAAPSADRRSTPFRARAPPL